MRPNFDSKNIAESFAGAFGITSPDIIKEFSDLAEEQFNDYINPSENEIRFISILSSVDRAGVEDLIAGLKRSHFFTVPGSVRHHSNWKGGLVDHSLKVYDIAMRLREEMIEGEPSIESQLEKDSIAIAALLHDVCKSDEFTIDCDGRPHSVAQAHRLPIGGHGYKSLVRILSWGFRLMLDEMLAIRWHMGARMENDKKEIEACKIAMQHPLCRLIAKADYEASHEKNSR